jgi:peptidoglycan/LPS O-acetylase OafA/YrhL
LEKQIPPKHIPTLDGWRAVAITMLLYGHAVGYAIPLPFNPGFCGVNLFFVLSGFLITHRLMTDYSDGKRIQFRKFYIRRVFRILPPAFAYLICIFLLGIWGAIPRWDKGILGAALFLRNYTAAPQTVEAASWFTGHFWSLAVEEHFYLFWPLALYLAGRRRARWVAISGILLCSGWRYVAWNYGITAGLDVPFYFRTDTRFDAVLVGSLLGLLYSEQRTRTVLEKLVTKRDTTVLLALYIWVLWRMFRPADLKELLLVAGLLAVTALHPRTWLGRVLNLGPICWIGRMSYSLYIWQELFLTPVRGRPLGLLNTFPFNIVATFIMAALSFYLLEVPMIKMGYKLTVAQRRLPSVTSREVEVSASRSMG